MVALTLLGFHGDFLVATTWWIFWCVNWPWYTTRVFWWFFRGNNPWHLDIEMIMVALIKTPRAWSGNGAGTKRERSGNEADSMISMFFHGFPWFSCLPLRSRFAPASLPLHSRFLFLVFFNVFCCFSSFFFLFFGFLNIFFDFLDVFMFFPWNCLVFFGKDSKFYE